MQNRNLKLQYKWPLHHFHKLSSIPLTPSNLQLSHILSMFQYFTTSSNIMTRVMECIKNILPSCHQMFYEYFSCSQPLWSHSTTHKIMSLIYFYQSCKLEWLFTFTMHILCYSQLYFFHDAIIKTTRGICLIS